MFNYGHDVRARRCRVDDQGLDPGHSYTITTASVRKTQLPEISTLSKHSTVIRENRRGSNQKRLHFGKRVFLKDARIRQLHIRQGKAYSLQM